VVIADGTEVPVRPPEQRRPAVLRWLAALAVLGATALGLLAWRERRRLARPA